MDSSKVITMYTLKYSYGLHHLEVEVPSFDFERVIDDLSKEFEISKSYCRWDSDHFNGYECLLTEFYITNYYGHKEKVGEKFERIVKL